MNATIAADLAIPSSVEVAFNTANTGDNFSLVNGSFGPTSLHSASKIWVSSGTLNPACSAIQVAGLPTTAALTVPTSLTLSLYASAPNIYFSSLAFSSAFTQYTLKREISSLNSL